MKIEYLDNAQQQLRTILGSIDEFEDQLRTASAIADVKQVSVKPLSPGLSGAAVFLVRRIGPQGPLVPWVAKVASEASLIINERRNYMDFIHERITAVPKLVNMQSSRVLFFEFGGALGEHNLQTLRSGYSQTSADSLVTLMQRLVRALSPLHQLDDDTVSSIERMRFTPPLEERVAKLTPKLPADVWENLLAAWYAATSEAGKFPRKHGTAHGDLNAGNILFEAGRDASHPVIIDFASMRKGGDKYHPPFWDFGKLERDIKTRLFLKEALSNGMSEADICNAVEVADRLDARLTTPISASPVVQKLWRTIDALRGSVEEQNAPNVFRSGYRLSVAYATLQVFYREQPDRDVNLKVQHLLAAKSATTLLSRAEGAGADRASTDKPNRSIISVPISWRKHLPRFGPRRASETNTRADSHSRGQPRRSGSFEQADWRYVGGFDRTDALLSALPETRVHAYTRYEYCRLKLKELFPEMTDEAFAAEARRVFENHIRRPRGAERVDLRDAKSALMIAYELMVKYSDLGRVVRGKSSRVTRGGKKPKSRIDVPQHFERIYPNTVNTFIKDIISITRDDNASTRLRLVLREADIAAAAKHIIAPANRPTKRSGVMDIASPEVHAAYTLGRIKSHAALDGAAPALKEFETEIGSRLAELSARDEHKQRHYCLMRRTALLSQATLGNREAGRRYVNLLLDSGIESDANSGFHLEYYCDQPLDDTLPLCSRDFGGRCEHTVTYLRTALRRVLDSDWDLNAHPLTLVEVYTLASIIARRSDWLKKDSLRPALTLLSETRERLDEDLRLYVDLCIELFDAPANAAASMIGEYMSAKNAPRNGWVVRGVEFPESVGAHTVGTLWLCNLIPEQDAARLNVRRIKNMLEVHDIAEGITGDILAPERNSEHDETERRLIRRLSWLGSHLNPRVDLYPLYSAYKEFKDNHTEEAALAHELDAADIVMQGTAILRSGAKCDSDSVRELVEKMDRKVQSQCGRTILDVARQMNAISESSFKVTKDSALKRYFGFHRAA